MQTRLKNGVSYAAPIVLAGLIIAGTAGCNAHPETPEICLDMCGAAAELYGSCLEGWGVSWSDAGFESEDSFLGSCETWAWEQSILTGDPTLVESVCSERLALLNAGLEVDDCTAYTEIDWNEQL
jgi:hypothetical protein